LAQPYSAGSGKAESGCAGNESSHSAKPTPTAQRTENGCGQAATNIDCGEVIENTSENTSRAEAAALRQAVVRTALTQATAFIKAWNFQAF
jgi:hypothetical protein